MPRPLRVLCLSPFFSPLANAEAFCGSKAVLSLWNAGVDIEVLAVDYAKHPKFGRDSSPLWQGLERVIHRIPPDGGRSKCFSLPFGLRFQWPEWSRWLATAITWAESRHKNHPYDVLYTRSLPNMAHIAGYWLARRTGLPWVANFNDPWELEATHLLPDQIGQRRRTPSTILSDIWQPRILRTATISTFPCAHLRDFHLRNIRQPPPTAIVPHIGWQSSASTTPSRHFQLVHAGSLGAGESTRRNATTYLLRGLKEIMDRFPEAANDIKLVLVGPEDRATLALAQDIGLSDTVHCTGRVSYEESLRWMANATVCLLVEGKMSTGIFLPSKLPDYLVAGRPVIALSPNRGTVADIATGGGIAQIEVDDASGIAAAIIQHYRMFKSGQIESYAPSASQRRRFSSSTIGCQLADILASAASAPLVRS